jgi:hypothetical protein
MKVVFFFVKKLDKVKKAKNQKYILYTNYYLYEAKY